MASNKIKDKAKTCVADESTLLQWTRQCYRRTSFEQFVKDGYEHFAYTVEDLRWNLIPKPKELLSRSSMDRLWVKLVLDFWVRMAWCGEDGDIEGIILALLEREDGYGVEKMWAKRLQDCPDLDINLYHPMVGHNGIFEDYLDLGVRAVIDPEIRSYLEKTEDGTDYAESDLGEDISNLKLTGHAIDEVTANLAEMPEETENGPVHGAVSNKLTESMEKTEDELAQNGTTKTQLDDVENPEIGADNATNSPGKSISNPDAAELVNDCATRISIGDIEKPDGSADTATNNLGEAVLRLDLTEPVHRDTLKTPVEDLQKAIFCFNLSPTLPNTAIHADTGVDRLTAKIAKTKKCRCSTVPIAFMRNGTDDDLGTKVDSERRHSLPNIQRKRTRAEEDSDELSYERPRKMSG